MGEHISDKAIEDGAKAVHEALLGSGTWLRANSAERSRSRHAVRLVIAALSKNGAPIGLAQVRSAPPQGKLSAAGGAEVFRDDDW